MASCGSHSCTFSTAKALTCKPSTISYVMFSPIGLTRQLGDRPVRLNFQGKNVQVSTLASYIGLMWTYSCCLQNSHLIQLLCMFLHNVHTRMSLAYSNEFGSDRSPKYSHFSTKFQISVCSALKKNNPRLMLILFYCVKLLLMVCKCSVVTIVCRHCLPNVLNK